jgi:hypothetical protein
MQSELLNSDFQYSQENLFIHKLFNTVIVILFMKYRVNAIVHITVLLFYISKPIIPYIEYAVFKEYIAKNLCINRTKPKSCCEGKCYLEKQLKKSADATSSDEKSTRKLQTNKDVKEFLISQITIPQATVVNFKQIIPQPIIILPQGISAIFVPPKA